MNLNHLYLLISISLPLFLTPIDSSTPYLIPQPIIRIFQPRGFEVSIPYIDGMQEFRISANRNVPLSTSSDQREIHFSKSTFEPDLTGRMSVQDRVARFRYGDRLYYRLMVRIDDREYRSLNEMFTVGSAAIFRQPRSNSEESNEDNPKLCDIYLHHHITLNKRIIKVRSTTSLPLDFQSPTTESVVTDLDNCNAKVYSLVKKISSLQMEVDRLDKDHTILYSIVNKLSYGKKFKLSGKISASDDPTTVVKFVLNEKLGITPDIATAIRKQDFILFSVDSLNITLQILEKVDEKLVGSKSIQITNYH